MTVSADQRQTVSRQRWSWPASSRVMRLAVIAACSVGIGADVNAQSAPDRPSLRPAVGVGSASQADVGVTAPVAPRRPVVKRAAGTLASSAAGCGSAGAIGVSRVQEIDTASTPQVGHQQYKDFSFLKDGEVVLTFDDGPLRPYTRPVLKALEAHCTKATFFVVGRMALADPALVKETAQRGHTVGTHTWSHMDLRKTGPSRARGEMELGISAVSRALGKPVAPFFRFPYLSDPKVMKDYAKSRNIGIFSIEVDSNDYRTKNPADPRREVLSQLESARKGIILFHDIQASTAGALLGLLDELKARGFKVVHMVPKGATTTLPEFDAIADREMARKSTAAADDPLASRSIVWPVSGGHDAAPGMVKAATQRPTKSALHPPVAHAQPELLPWGVTTVSPTLITPSTSAPRPAPPRERKETSSFFTNPFGF
jgi:peptidoglycan-N-acetylglucosamine deacetylase